MKKAGRIAIKACLGVIAFGAGAWFVVQMGSAEAAPAAIARTGERLFAAVAACPDAVALCENGVEGADSACSARCESTNHKAGVCQMLGVRPVECWCTNDHQRWALASPLCSK